MAPVLDSPKKDFEDRNFLRNEPLGIMGRVPRLGGFEMADYWVWCPSVIRGEDGRFCMFASRWPKSIPFHPGWLTSSEVVLAVADTAVGPYEFQQVILPARGAEYWDGCATHNSRIVRYGGGYALFYTGMTHPFSGVQPHEGLDLSDPRVITARASKRVGVALAERLSGPWRRLDAPVLPTKPGTFYSFLTSNPAPCVSEDGSVRLIFKARSYVGHVHGPMHLGVAHARTIEGPYEILSAGSIFSPDRLGEIEDPFVWRSGTGYELIAKDMTGKLCGEYHGGMHAWSPDGVEWQLHAQPKAYSRMLRWDDGTVQNMGALERPFLLIENDRPTHLFAAVADGPGGFAHAHRTWNAAIPLG